MRDLCYTHNYDPHHQGGRDTLRDPLLRTEARGEPGIRHAAAGGGEDCQPIAKGRRRRAIGTGPRSVRIMPAAVRGRIGPLRPSYRSHLKTHGAAAKIVTVMVTLGQL